MIFFLLFFCGRPPGRRWERSETLVKKGDPQKSRRLMRRKVETGRPVGDVGGPIGEAGASAEVVRVKKNLKTQGLLVDHCLRFSWHYCHFVS